FLSHTILHRCIEALKKFDAVDVVVDATDTIVEVENSLIKNIPDRRYLKRGQTPQAFKKSLLQKAYSYFIEDPNKSASDDCGIVLKYIPETKIITVKGEEENFKITHQQDIYLADNLIKDGLFARMEHNNQSIKESIKDKVV